MNQIATVVEENIEEAFKKVERNIEKPNILLVGGTGVGKSSIINHIFGEKIAEVGTGSPVTQSLNKYESPDLPVVLYDTKGYEIGEQKQKEFLEDVIDFAVKSDQDVDKQIHLLWYCIDASSHRITDLDIKTIKKLYNSNLPISILFTKADLLTKIEIEKLEEEIKNELPNIKTFRITTIDIPELDYLDIKKLINWSIERLPKGLQFSFIKAQKRELNKKKKEAKKFIMQHSSSSALVGGSPIPFSDAPILLANQGWMYARITSVYDIDNQLANIKGLMKNIGAGAILSKSGIYIASQIIKMVPAAGSVVGGAISATVATALTAAVGYALSEYLYRLSNLILEGRESEIENMIKNMEPIVTELVKKYYKREEKKVEDE
jgi:uncharacterized protein (DUF697 family)/GTP-binding protein EngB required for normal cell division